MIETQEKRLETVLSNAINKADKPAAKQLVSYTQEIDHVKPLEFFEAAKYQHMDRTFWFSTQESFFLIGAGVVDSLTASEDRFQAINHQWESILSEATIHNPYQAPGTGLVSFGGMCFDQRKKRTDLWKKFKDSAFQIPRFSLVQTSQTSYLTINTYMDKMDNAKERADTLRSIAKTLMRGISISAESVSLERVEEMESERWKNQVLRTTEDIKQGKAEKIVLARELRLKLSGQAEIAPLLNQLMETQSNCYIFAIERGDDCFIGATPERLVKWNQKQLLSTSLAGTAPRGETVAEDKKIGETLLQDPKNRGEHDFVVQMIKQAMQYYCLDIRIPEEPVLHPLKNLQHLYTPVTATLKQGYSIFDVVEALHPTPALGGVPREESLRFIREYEMMERGWYGAPIGWLDSSQNGEFAVAIRSGLVQSDEASLFAGCGVVGDSDPDEEYEETSIKFKPMLSIFGG